MDGHVSDEVLLTYYLGASDAPERDRVDAHLASCGGCLRAFFELKHHVEQSAQAGVSPRPSAATRERLRANVAAAFRPTVLARVRRTLGRPIPLYQGLAAAVLAVALAVSLPSLRARSRHVAPPSGERVDTARLSPESLTIY
jgi:anti-sigma factor RsiW